jgi:hypothetical protein
MFVGSTSPRLAREFAEARRMRLDGVPMRTIAATLGVSISSVSVWTRDIELTAEQRAANLARAAAARGPAWSERNREQRRRYQREGRARARLEDPLHIAGCMLYWAEGAKSRNQAAIANSDPAIVEAFLLFLRSCFNVTVDDLTFNLNAYTGNGLTIGEIELFWMKRLGLRTSCARKHTVNHFPTSSSGKRPKKLPYGVCTLKAKKSTWIVQHIYGAIQEYAGIDCPEWLDGPPRRSATAD